MFTRISVIKSILALCVMMTCVQHAEARRGFRFIPIPGIRSESIELVKRLPDTEAFSKDGKYYDFGYLHGKGREGYVLYHGDSFIQLDAEALSALTAILGYDPAAGHRRGGAAVAESATDRSGKDESGKQAMIAAGQMIERNPGESSEAYAKRKQAFIAQQRVSSGASSEAASNDSSESTGGPGVGGFGLVFLLIAGLLAFGPKLLRKLREAGVENGAAASSATNASTMSFDERVAARLRELEVGGSMEAATTAPHPQPVSGRPQASGFGRRGL